MKSEAQIRRHRDNLLVCMEKPCGCAGEHVPKCELGRLMIFSTAQTLSWILGEFEDMNDLVNEIHQDVQAYKRVN